MRWRWDTPYRTTRTVWATIRPAKWRSGIGVVRISSTNARPVNQHSHAWSRYWLERRTARSAATDCSNLSAANGSPRGVADHGVVSETVHLQNRSRNCDNGNLTCSFTSPRPGRARRCDRTKRLGHHLVDVCKTRIESPLNRWPPWVDNGESDTLRVVRGWAGHKESRWRGQRREDPFL